MGGRPRLDGAHEPYAVPVSAGWSPWRCRITSATSAISCSRSRWYSSSFRSHSSRLGKRLCPRKPGRPRKCPCLCMCFTSFPVTLKKARDGSLRADERLGPAIEQAPPFGRQLVSALGRAGKVCAPLGLDEPFLLERAQEAVEVADVDAPLHAQLRDPFEQLVAVQRPLPQEQEQRRLDEALDPCVHVPVARADEAPAAGSTVSSVRHRQSVSLGKKHMS